MKAAFLTYNHVGHRGSVPNGWRNSREHAALVLQSDWINQVPADILSVAMVLSDLGSNAVGQSIGGMFSALAEIMPELDKVVVYVGSYGSEKAIDLAKALPPEKVVFVLCDCGLAKKRQVIRDAGLTQATCIMCDCGGDRHMGLLLQNFLRCGEVKL